MPICPIPENEDERLASVHAYKILDTAPEVEFDVTTRVAAALFDTPIALVALMDRDRLWFKSRHGLDVTHLNREIAFCAHAIVKPEDLLVINDLRTDPRFDDNPLVHGGPGIRFYAGAPLRDSKGLALGTLAVLGTEPRDFDAKSRALLRDLSVSVMTALEARQRSLSLKQMATTDALTGLANRIQFQAAASLELRQAQLADQAIGLLYMDLDGFKDINDRLGHGAGDAVLQEVAEARSANLSSLIEHADNALYRAKVQTQKRWAIFSDQAQEKRVMPLRAGGEVLAMDATSDQCGECAEGVKQPFPFTMAFQPIVSASRQEVFAYEALVRGLSGEAASTILSRVNRRNRYAFDQSCRKTAIDLAARLGIAELGAKLSINIIPGAMYEPENCVRATLAAARRANLPLDRLIFEVTEGVETVAEFRTLRALGIDLFQGYLFASPGFESFPKPVFPQGT